MRKPKRKLLVVGAFILVILAAGVAFAAWTGTGTGSGTAKSITVSAVTVNPDGTGAADLYPGSSGNVYFTLNNPNPYSITFTSMTPGTLSATLPSGCPAATNLTVDTVPSGLSIVAPPGLSTLKQINGVVHMNAGALDACQGKSFDIPLTLSGSQT